MTADAMQPDLVAVRRLHKLIARLNSEADLDTTLQAVVEGVVLGTGFEVAAIYYRQPDGTFEALAVAGPPDARTAILSQSLSADAFDRDLDAAERWGSLRFVPHDRFTPGMVAHWIPETGSQGATDVANAPSGAGTWHPLDALFVPLYGPTGPLVGILSVDSPVDGRRPGPWQRELLDMFAAQAGIAVDNARLRLEVQLHHERLEASEAALRLAFDNSALGMGIFTLTSDTVGRYVRVNDALCELTGYTASELLTRGPVDITYVLDAAADARAGIEALAGQRKTYRTEKRYVRADRKVIWVAVTTSVVGRVGGPNVQIMSVVEDITARLDAEQTLLHRALHDPLTGLLNRHALTERLTQAIQRVQRGRRSGGVLFCDLDGFKAINDRFGHQQGDAVLLGVAKRLAAQVRAVDALARIGGDEFVIVAEQVTIDELERLSARVQHAVCQPLTYAGDLQVTISIGIAALTADTADPRALLQEADAAMYRDKIARRPSTRPDGNAT